MELQKELQLADVEIGFRNFAGREGAYNREGDRNFVIFLRDQEAKNLEEQGWNVKWPKPLDDPDEEDTRQPYLPVAVSLDPYPPKIVLVAGDKPTLLHGDDIDVLDTATIDNVDAVIRPYSWSVNGNSGVKAYLKAIYVTIATDGFEAKYGI